VAPSIASPVNFDNPPVGEVALAVQLVEPATDDTITLGRFWPRVQGDYPKVEPQPPLPPMSEDFGIPGPSNVSFQILDRPPSARYWLLSADEAELIQVQPDRFAYNWRKGPTDASYPRYAYLRGRFEDVLRTFIAVVEEQGRTVLPSWCEVTYINPIAGNGESRPDLSEILKRIAPEPPSPLPGPEDSNFAERFVLERDGAPFGRFYINASPAFSVVDRLPIYMLTLTARGMASTPDIAGVLDFLDEGRDFIVKSFRDMTTPEMHRKWGLQ